MELSEGAQSGSHWPLSVGDARFSIPPHALGHMSGVALSRLIESALAGAGVGALPHDATELLEERLHAEEEHRLLQLARGDGDVCWTHRDAVEPLVSICIPTIGRNEELMEMSIPSALGQTHDNIEVIVVGDNAPDSTEHAVASIADPRVRYVNRRGPNLYPEDRYQRWLVGGSVPMNLAVELARGSWIAPAADDDELTADHVEVLLNAALEHRLEFVWSKTLMDTPDGWQVVGSEPMSSGATSQGAVMWSSGLRFMRMSTTCWKLGERSDGNLWRRMTQIGVRMGFVDRITYKHFIRSIDRQVLEAAP